MRLLEQCRDWDRRQTAACRHCRRESCSAPGTCARFIKVFLIRQQLEILQLLRARPCQVVLPRTLPKVRTKKKSITAGTSGPGHSHRAAAGAPEALQQVAAVAPNVLREQLLQQRRPPWHGLLWRWRLPAQQLLVWLLLHGLLPLLRELCVTGGCCSWACMAKQAQLLARGLLAAGFSNACDGTATMPHWTPAHQLAGEDTASRTRHCV